MRGRYSRAIALTAGGVPGYTYLWNTGTTTDSIGGLFKGIYSCTVTDSLGCQVVGITGVDGWAVGLEPLPEVLEGSEGPNPTTGTSIVELAQGEAIVAILTDALGREVLCVQPGSGRFTLSLEGLPTGLYGLRVQTSTQWATSVME